MQNINKPFYIKRAGIAETSRRIAYEGFFVYTARMFTGIVEKKTRVLAQRKEGRNLIISVERPTSWKMKIGDSVAVAGVCLTVAKMTKTFFEFVVMPETLRKTTLGKLIPKVVNLERSMKFGDRLHGHIVQGHVDGVGIVKNISAGKSGRLISITFPKKFSRLVVLHGSITIDGVSLTIARKTSITLTVALVPHTLKVTTLGNLAKGDCVNLEFDILCKSHGTNKR